MLNMAIAELNVLFKKIQKDDKKEILEFHVQGDELPHSEELVGMAGSIVVLNVIESPAESMNVEYKTIQRDSKKTVLKFNVNGSGDKMNQLYPYAGTNVKLALKPSQMSIEEFEDQQHDAIVYKVNKSGVVEVEANQLSIDDVKDEDSLD